MANTGLLHAVIDLEELMQVFRTLPWLLLAVVAIDAIAAH
jgi:hypothetical protein